MSVPVRMSLPFGFIARTARPAEGVLGLGELRLVDEDGAEQFLIRLYAGHWRPSRDAVHAW